MVRMVQEKYCIIKTENNLRRFKKNPKNVSLLRNKEINETNLLSEITTENSVECNNILDIDYLLRRKLLCYR